MGWHAEVDFRPSKTHGMGAFALAPIKAGSKVWQIDKTMNIVGLAELGALTSQELHFALHGGYLHLPSQRFVYYDDGMQYVNHAPTPIANIGIPSWTPLMQDHCTALRDIEPGEELLEDYSFWSILQLEDDHWLVDLYRDFCPGHYAFLSDIERQRRAA